MAGWTEPTIVAAIVAGITTIVVNVGKWAYDKKAESRRVEAENQIATHKERVGRREGYRYEVISRKLKTAKAANDRIREAFGDLKGLVTLSDNYSSVLMIHETAKVMTLFWPARNALSPNRALVPGVFFPIGNDLEAGFTELFLLLTTDSEKRASRKGVYRAKLATLEVHVDKLSKVFVEFESDPERYISG